MKWMVKAAEGGVRLDQFVTEKSGLSRSQIHKFIKLRKVIYNGKECTKSGLNLKVGDRVYFRKPKWFGYTEWLNPEKGVLEVIYEDEYMMAVNKPPFLVVHPAVGNHHGTLLNLVMGYLKQKKYDFDLNKPILIHRLDKNTSGVILVAKSDLAYKPIANLFAERMIQKKYLALVIGHLKKKEGIIEAPIARHRANRLKMAISNEANAKAAVTHYKVLREIGKYSLLELEPKTGRTHQLRVHLNAIGYPVVGDEVYGREKENKLFVKMGLKRQFLHAFSLSFKHPFTKEVMNLEATLTQDLQGVLKLLEEGEKSSLK